MLARIGRHVTLVTLVALVPLGISTASPHDPPPPKFGVFLAFSGTDAFVTSTVSGSIADIMGVSAGDKILEFNDNAINNKADADAFLADCSPLRHVLYLRKSDGKKVTITLGSNPYSFDPSSGKYSIKAGLMAKTVSR